jgi:hypothetical protein
VKDIIPDINLGRKNDIMINHNMISRKVSFPVIICKLLNEKAIDSSFWPKKIREFLVRLSSFYTFAAN